MFIFIYNKNIERDDIFLSWVQKKNIKTKLPVNKSGSFKFDGLVLHFIFPKKRGGVNNLKETIKGTYF